MIGADCDDGITLLPLKDKRDPGDQRAHRRDTLAQWDSKQGGCRRAEEEEDRPPAVSCGGGRRFEDSREWKWTKEVCAGLFRVLGRYYDEQWFPTVIREWCLLYYRCSYASDYWQCRDEWLAGDEEIRMAVWTAILCERTKNDKRVNDLKRRALRNAPDCGGYDSSADLADVEDEEEAAKVVAMHGALNEANELIDLKRVDVQEMNANLNVPEMTDEEIAQAELEAAELALADPDDDPNWVDMRRRMRGSFAALNLARCVISTELLDHIMIELCKYWANAPDIEHCIDPLLEKNIMREIKNFRFKLFNVNIDDEPEKRADDYQSLPEPEEEPEMRCSGGPSPMSSRRPSPCAPPAPMKKRSKSKASCRGPATNKLAETRARASSARMQQNCE